METLIQKRKKPNIFIHRNTMMDTLVFFCYDFSFFYFTVWNFCCTNSSKNIHQIVWIILILVWRTEKEEWNKNKVSESFSLFALIFVTILKNITEFTLDNTSITVKLIFFM